MRYILTDIEGTTTATSFVYDTLFPYFKENITSFLRSTDALEKMSPLLQQVKETVRQEENRLLSFDGIAQQLIHWTDTDRKHPALKSLQGILWRFAYEKGIIQGHVYADVPPALASWHQKGIGLGVYSSGSVEAQQLLFRYSIYGDLTPYFSHYFDTQVGQKRETKSYQSIAQILELPTNDILFLSDIEAELDAAAAVGMSTIQLVRAGTIPSLKHKMVADFSEIII